MSELRRVGVIDVGTVTARVGMADIRDRVVLSIARESRICNLGEGVDATGLIDDGAIARVLDAVDGFIGFLREHGCQVVGCFLTSAARDARNVDVLLDALRARGLAPEVLSGKVEGAPTTAASSSTGATPSTSAPVASPSVSSRATTRPPATTWWPAAARPAWPSRRRCPGWRGRCPTRTPSSPPEAP